jgi:hypothetical protein
MPPNCTELVDNLNDSGVLRTDNGGSVRRWQVIDYTVTNPAQFFSVVTVRAGDFRDPNDSKIKAVYKLSAGKSPQ